MDIAQAKQIPLEMLLERLGHSPARVRGDDLWYASPLRDESDPSFKLNRSNNRWHDFGEGYGGDAIDLVARIYRLDSVSEALSHLDQIFGSTPPTQPVNPPIWEKSKPAIDITSITPVRSKSLIAYLRQRGIDPKLAAPYIQEIHYRAGGNKEYFAIGFANDKGGFELRNPHFKGATSKDITTIAGDPSRVICFEGFFDYLTAVTMFGGKLHGTAIVLNSVGMKDRAIKAIRKLDPITVELYRDADPSGEQLLSYFQRELPDKTIVDWASLYAEDGHKDFNAWHMAQCHPTRVTSQHSR